MNVEQARHYVEKLKDQQDSLINCVRHFLRFCREGSDNLMTDLPTLLSDVKSFAQLAGKQRGEEVILELDPSLADIRVPDVPVRHALLNVVYNGLLHTEAAPSGTREVRISAGINGSPDGHITIRVTDTGTGIHADDLERIFEPYITTREDGTGLGLYLARQLLSAIGGSIDVEETFIFGGTTFCITIPVQKTRR